MALLIVGSLAGETGDNCLVGNVAGVSVVEGSVDGTCNSGNDDPMVFTGEDCLLSSLGLNVVNSSWSKMKDCA